MRQPASTWRIVIELPDLSCIAAFDEAIAFDNTVVLAQEIGGGPRWCLTGHRADAPDRANLEIRVALAAASVGIEPPVIVIDEIPATDWVADYLLRTNPITVGRFFVFPSHFEGVIPDDLIGIRLDAGLAFGTGEHQSTSGCLVALEGLMDKGFTVECALDMGCGSGILAIAMARLWPDATIIAVDNDPNSVSTAINNIAVNACARAVSVAKSDGCDSMVVQSRTPFDLIVANILAQPLIAMASDAATSVTAGASVILSGILSEQAEMVLDNYRIAGFLESDRQDLAGWTTLVLEKR